MSIIAYTSGNFPTYRFYVSGVEASLLIEVFPLNFNETALVDELDKDQIFYRRKFSGTLLFGTNSIAIDDDGAEQNRRDDWDLFWGYEQVDPCQKIYLTITKTVDGGTDTYWEGLFSTTDGFFDIDACTFEVTPQANDDYVDILDNADIKYNILNAATKVTTRAIQGLSDVTYTRNRWLARIGSNSVLEYIAGQVAPGAVVSSTFFTAVNNPATLNPNHLLYLTIAQKSDIVDPTSSDPSWWALMSWNELMNILWVMFQVKWDYDGTTIRIEHISFWDYAAGMDGG